jgi:hypothetical protein
VITAGTAVGLPIDEQMVMRGPRNPEAFGLQPQQLRVTVIAPQGDQDLVGIVTTLDGAPLPPADIAGRIGGFADIEALEKEPQVSDSELIEKLLGAKNELHNNYQDFQAFLDSGGRIGLQHDPLLYGAPAQPFSSTSRQPRCWSSARARSRLKSYVGLRPPTRPGRSSSSVNRSAPGHRGIWREALLKYPLNPRIYAAEKVPTFILTLNWADASSVAHNLDAQLSPIEGKSREASSSRSTCRSDHVPDTKAPKVISMVG